MEGNGGNYTDKTRVLDIKPLRTLRPVFPSGNQAPPFVCAPPFGPFPPGFSSFYPFSSSQANQHTPDLNQAQYPQQHQQPQNPPPVYQQPQNASEPSLVTPLRSFRSPDASNGNTDLEGSTVKRKIPKRRPIARPENMNFESGINVAERENGNRELVVSVLMRFDALRRRFAQLEDAKEAVSGVIKRPDLKAGSTCMGRGVRTNTKKRPGIVAGVEIGDVFFFRFEMCLVGLHSPSMAGIDYLVVKGEAEEEPIATSIVSSGYYDNDEGNPDVLIYTGQGGNADKDKQSSDQKLERGNLALEKSLHRNSAVRVIRGLKEASHNAKIYIYDGLYEIKESWVEKGKSGHNTFKYKLVRAPGQPPAFATWTAIQKWKTGLPSRQGLILPDMTSGVESIPVSLVNEVDTDNGPAYFTYSTTVKYSESFKLTQPSFGCDCANSCKPGNLDCHCIRKNGGDFPYTNYLKLGKLEFDLLSQHSSHVPTKIAFVGSGPMPLTSIVLAKFHLPNTTFHNFDIDSHANTLASNLVSRDPDLSKRMIFHTTDVLNATEGLDQYDVVFLAALVGMDKESKVKAIEHLEKHMAPGAVLMLRSAHALRAFLYPIVDSSDLKGFQLLTIYHPTDDVVNSVVIARKLGGSTTTGVNGTRGCMFMPCNCSKIHAIMNNRGKKNMIEECSAIE